ncbi:hypothetical protein AWM70_15585 [Paenibacillus yonginensis]|uniref:SH3b domain-containing protein n=1 Tax=Paenibacillus yonginensis TaxID=1462996 RepID=A0A1B1N315_9BACL|nr:hypothetical protein [Paenibacillus yonginensis]ANS75831.1 hypothetical protein AWM70_15585 [Paenibacillus yonginensis]
MKKIAALTASFALSAALATAASAAPADTTSTDTSDSSSTSTVVTGQVVSTTSPDGTTYDGTVAEPIIVPELITIAPAPLTLNEVTYFYDMPQGKAQSALAPQTVTPTGNIVGDWVEIYTWLGKAWVYAPGYIAYP